ncbi:MAG: hypothetical protein IPJ33_01925 [Gammaproteobacteria bacterium]|jgi:hypothetical protein|nr:hypothetical protein [Gammaproteobacteria bacterium]MBP6228272.1 hypothetical protein [Pseudomonadales bacterium]MBK6583901.1 hypothetical protein [Gammaproteobacteria bacterium]MBK7169801.1 hypothetical protein [Gammaproteobacteria bacterium]MBK7727279.1 hypothetical protein [Gammaproteobacteria bacterium]
MSEDRLDPLALRMLAWACLWSPLADDAEHQEAWELLALPGVFADVRLDYWNSFHAGSPQPPISLLFHALLRREGSSAREDLMRAADYLDLESGDKRLPPDHLGPACEVFGLAIERQEAALVHGLRERYLRPWAQQARAMLGEHPALLALVDRLAADIESAPA